MPVRYVIDHEHRLVVATGWGVLTFGEAQACMARLGSDPEFNPAYASLLDMSAVTDFPASHEQLRTLAKVRYFSPRSRKACVASTPLIFGLFRVLEAYHDDPAAPGDTRVFYSREEALAWLGVKNG